MSALTVKDTQGNDYDLLYSLMLESSGFRLVLRKDLRTVFLKLRKRTHTTAIYHCGPKGSIRVPVGYTKPGRKGLFYIGCRGFGRAEEEKLKRWAMVE